MKSTAMLPHPHERFTGRVQSYRRFRPRYPAEIVDLLRQECGMSDKSALLDVAAGTGLLTEIFLAAGFAVTAIEPNPEMRAACSTLERSYPKLCCISGTAEETGLPDASVDLITVAQAMHWFDPKRTRMEFARILKPGGWCAVIYNHRRIDGDAFHEDYERLLRAFGIDYTVVMEQHVDGKGLAEFFAPAEMKYAVFENAQALNETALEGRILSSSYMPQAGHPQHEEMRRAAKKLFAEHATGDAVTLRYDCAVCYGQLPPLQGR